MGFLDEFRFLRGALAQPRAVGAIAPSSRALACAIAAEIDPAGSGRILELGPGTGAVTQALVGRGIAPNRITAIEHDAKFARLIGARYPDCEIIEGDAFDLATSLSEKSGTLFAAVVSGLPLLAYPVAKRIALIETAFAWLKPGAPFVQFSYGLWAPVAPPRGASVKLAAIVWRNLPPARVWTYRRT